MPSKHLFLCHPLLLLPSIQHQGLFQWNRWPKYWHFSFSISPSYEYSGLISFRIDLFDLLAAQRTLKNLLQHHSSKASILQQSAFFTVQLSHAYMMTGKTIALTGWTFVGKVMSLLFNMLSRLVIPFLLRNKHLLTLWLQSPSTVILEPKVSHCFHCSPSTCHEVMKWLSPDAMILVFWMLSFKPYFSLSSFTFIKRLFSYSLSAIRVVSSVFLSLLLFLLATLIPACASSSLSFHMICIEVRLQPMGSLKVGHNWVTSLSLFLFMHWRRKWQPTPVFLPGESQGWGSLVGCCLWGCTESDTTEAMQQQQQHIN